MTVDSKSHLLAPAVSTDDYKSSKKTLIVDSVKNDSEPWIWQLKKNEKQPEPWCLDYTLNFNVLSSRIPSISSDFPHVCPRHLVFKFKGDVKCAFLQGDLDEQQADDDDDDNFKMVSAQPVSDTFCEPFPEFSQKLLRNMRSEESVMEPCLWTFRDGNGVIHALCLVYVDDFMLACNDPPIGKHVFDSINHLYEWGEWESRVFKQCGAQASDKHTGTWRI